MIKKSILIGVILLLAFEIFIRVGNINWDTSQNDKSANLISAQNYIYNLSKEKIANDTVVIGSSISRKLTNELLGHNYVNLAFNAWSSYDGLELVKRTNTKPKCLLIEMNVVGNQSLQEDVVSSLSPVSFNTNRIFKSFQLQNQPVGLVVGSIKNMLKAKMEEMKKKKRDNLELYNYNLSMEKKKMENPLPDSVFTNRFKVLKELVDGFKNQGIKIVFFEVPFDKELSNTKEVLTTRKFYYQYFPKSEYKYVDLPAENNYVFSDGIHLSLQSAPLYTAYLKNELTKQ